MHRRVQVGRHRPHRGAGGETFGRIDDGIGVDAVVAVELADGAGLAEMLDAERFDAMPGALSHGCHLAQRPSN